MRYSKERQYCFRLYLSRPEHEKLCCYIEYRDKERFPYLASYLLAACEALEKKDAKMPESNLSKESMDQIRDVFLQAVAEHEGKSSGK